MCNRVKYHISHKDAFSAVIACRTASGQFSTAQPEEQPAGSRGAERWFQRTCEMSSARAAHGKPPSFLYKNNTKKNWLKLTTYFNLYKFTTPFLYISWFIIFLHVALWTYHLLSHHLGMIFLSVWIETPQDSTHYHHHHLEMLFFLRFIVKSADCRFKVHYIITLTSLSIT